MVVPLPAQSTTVPGHIGHKLRQRRRALGLSQQQLAAQAGISFQQLQKYEQGKNELNAQRLMAFSSLLGVTVTYFFEGLENRSGSDADDDAAPDVSDTRETQALARHHRNIPDSTVRQGITRLARHLAGLSNESDSGPNAISPQDL